MQGNTGSVFPLWYLLTPKNYHVKVSFQCVAFLMLHPLEFIDINYMELFEFPQPQFSLYNFHLWYCSIFLYFCIFPYPYYSFVFLNLLIFSHLPTVFSPCCPVKYCEQNDLKFTIFLFLHVASIFSTKGLL